jgi:hypothetical protein
MAVISSKDDDVSSMAEACRDAPSASDWPVAATSPDADAT